MSKKLILCIFQNHLLYFNIGGEHTRQKSMAQCKVGGLVGFTKKLPTCLGCKAVLRNVDEENSPPTCEHCKPQLSKIYSDRVCINKIYFKNINFKDCSITKL